MKILKTFAVQLFTGFNIATLILLWASCLVTYLHPAAFPKLSLLSLAFPLFLLLNVAFILFWLIFKAKRTWLPVVGIALCYSFCRDYCPINPPFLQAEQSDSAATLRVITYNTRSYGGKAAKDEAGNNIVAAYIYSSDADIICLQESASGGATLASVKDHMQELGYECYDAKGTVIFSRLPILDGDTISFPTRSNNGVMAHLLDGKDTLLLINSHMESNHLSEIIKDGYRDALKNNAPNAYQSDARDTLRKELSPVVNLLTEAAPLRAAQADTLQRIIQSWQPRPVIVCGDFNDTPVSYTLRVLSRHLQNAFRESGNGVGFTFKDRGFPVRIDHILFSAEYWQSRHTHVEKAISASDHFPISTELVRKTPKKP